MLLTLQTKHLLKFVIAILKRMLMSFYPVFSRNHLFTCKAKCRVLMLRPILSILLTRIQNVYFLK